MANGNGFTFFQSYFDAALSLTDPVERVAFYDAICTYVFKGETIELSGGVMGMFLLAKPNLDKSIEKARAGAKGGLTNNSKSKPEANAKQTKSNAKQTRSKREANEIKCEANAKQTKSKDDGVGVGVGVGIGIGDGVGVGDGDNLSFSDENDCPTSSDLSAVANAWNALGLNQLQKFKAGTKRYDMTKCRIRDYGLDEVLRAIDLVGQSDFLMGRKKDFMATYDWFIRPNNFEKVLSGNYADRSNSEESSNIFLQLLKEGAFDDE